MICFFIKTIKKNQFKYVAIMFILIARIHTLYRQIDLHLSCILNEVRIINFFITSLLNHFPPSTKSLYMQNKFTSWIIYKLLNILGFQS